MLHFAKPYFTESEPNPIPWDSVKWDTVELEDTNLSSVEPV